MRLDDAARLYLGTPYRHQGRDPTIGIDCVGLVVLALELGGHPAALRDVRNYSADPHHGLLEQHLARAFGPPVSGMQVGEIVAMEFCGAVRHVGIVGENERGLTLIHTARNFGKVVEHGINARWARRIAGVYRP